MTAREPRRRRRTAPATSMPRPTGDEGAQRRTQQASRLREHHVTTDYSYVRKDLALITGITVVTLGFIVAMSVFL